MPKQKQVNKLEQLINVLEDKGLTVNIVDDIENALTLKLNSENALDVVVNKLVELAVDKELNISSNSKVSNNELNLVLLIKD